MKRPNITPGPWKTNHDPEAIADVWQDSTNPRRFVSCSPFTGNRSRMREKEKRDEWAANARAIAAVPKLLAALERCLPDDVEDDGTLHDGKVAGEISMGDMRAIKEALIEAGYTFD